MLDRENFRYKGDVPTASRPQPRALDGFVVPRRPYQPVVRPQQQPQPTQAHPNGVIIPAESVEERVCPRMTIPAYEPRLRPTRLVNRHRARKWSLRFASLFVALFLATGGFLFWQGYANLHKVFRGSGEVAALSNNVNPDQLKGEGDGRVNILLLGIGGPGHDGADLTDTMLLLSVDPVNDKAVLLSIPRDLWVKMPNNFIANYQKINAAYESGKYAYLGGINASNANPQAILAGFSAVDTTLKMVTGLNINYHVLVNFQAFQQAINTVGGVTVDVKQPLVDPTMAWENGWNPVLAPAGVQSMDGRKALMYARSRETTSDFARTERQRQIIVALKDKILTAGTLSNPAKISGLMNAFGDNVFSDLSTQGATRLYSILRDIPDDQIRSIGLADSPNNFVTTDRVGTASVVRPTAGFNNYTAMQAYIRSQLPDGYIKKENARVFVVGSQGTDVSTEAAAQDLKTYGYNIAGAAAVLPDQPGRGVAVVDLSKGQDPYTANYLKHHFGVTLQTQLPSNLRGVELHGAKFVIMLAENETARS